MPSSKEDNRPARMKPGKWYRIELNKDWDSTIPIGIIFAGCYAIFVDGKCIYIGQSENLGRRLRSHIQMGRYDNSWKTRWGSYKKIVIAIRKEKFRYERMSTEARLIHRLRPLCNQFVSENIIGNSHE